MVVMQMGDDNVPDGFGLDAEPRQRLDRIERQLAISRLCFSRIEAGIDQNLPAATADQPNEIIQILRGGLMRIRHQEIELRGARRHRRIAQRIYFIDVSHRSLLLFGWRLGGAQ